MTKSYSSRSLGVLNTLPRVARNSIAVAGLLTLVACSSSDPTTGDPVVTTGSYAFAATRSSDYGSGRTDRISLSDGNTINGSYPATLSDIAVTTDDTNLYQIARSGMNWITRFDAGDTSITDYEFIVNDAANSEGIASPPANPYSLAFLTESKAYLTRYGSSELWIIDPRGETEETFKTGGIDLSAYDADVPNMSDALIVGDKLFVLLERLNTNFAPVKSAYLVVIDTLTDTEIETNQGASDLLGIELSVRNPTALQYNTDTGEIYVVGRGSYFASADITDDTHSGGIEVIDPDTFEHQVLIDDGTDADNQGYFYDIEVVNASLGYLLTYQSFGVTTLRTFNPTTGLLSDDLIEGIQDLDITVLAQGPDNHLWIGLNSTTPGFMRLDLATGVVADEIVATALIPIGLTFITLAAQ
jgi:hypothetical protein